MTQTHARPARQGKLVYWPKQIQDTGMMLFDENDKLISVVIDDTDYRCRPAREDEGIAITEIFERGWALEFPFTLDRRSPATDLPEWRKLLDRALCYAAVDRDELTAPERTFIDGVLDLFVEHLGETMEVDE